MDVRKILTGIGSRETPDDVLDLMHRIAYMKAKEGFLLRSGGADGADTAFEVGFKTFCAENSIPFEERMCIYLPWVGFNERSGKECVSLTSLTVSEKNFLMTCAQKVHPAFSRLSTGAMLLHTRNILQIRGHEKTGLRCSDEIVYWTPGKIEPTGGTRTAVKFAEYLGLKTQNLNDSIVRKKYEMYVSGFEF